MKKIIVRLVIALLVLLVLAGVAVHLFLDGAIKRGVETFGPELTKVQVKLEYVNLSLLTGSGKIRGLLVGNPEGYKTPSPFRSASAAWPCARPRCFPIKLSSKAFACRARK